MTTAAQIEFDAEVFAREQAVYAAARQEAQDRYLADGRSDLFAVLLPRAAPI